MRSGGYGEVVTPVPIPNTEVKHFSGEDSLTAKRARCQVSKDPYGSFSFSLSFSMHVLFVLFLWKQRGKVI